MRLASKIFLTSSLVIIVLVAVGALSLRAVGRLVSVNREIVTHSVPALRLGTSVRDAMPSLVRMETRAIVLRDARFAALWDEGATRAEQDLDHLHAVLTTERERVRWEDVMYAFAAYREVVERERDLLARRDHAGALRLAESEGRATVERVEAALEELTRATEQAIYARQAEVARLELRTWTGVLVSLGAALGLALLGTAFIAWRMTRSLRRLSEATASVAAGSFRDPIEVNDRDEVGELARSFNAMATQLRQMDRLKEDFLATISHELRSPLTSVREAAHLLVDEVPGPLTVKQQRLVGIISASSDRLLGLVNRILDLARLRAGLLPLEHKVVDLDRVVTRGVDELRPQAEEAGVTLDRERVGENFAYTGDEERLVQVVVNLVANAIRFTPRGGSVRARLVDAGPEIEIQVEDTGIGIPVAVLPRIFEPYRQAHRERGGTGLGLAIVRGIVQAHGGRVTVESTEGKGSRFTVLLPRRRAA
ncbi:MAG: ATP-binding protein [Candidatus Rokuibacteriota bacterium]